MCERMELEEVIEKTGLCKETLFKLMDLGAADLGAVVPGKKKTYVFFRPKVERFVNGSDFPERKELLSSLKMMNMLLTETLASLPGGTKKLYKIMEG